MIDPEVINSRISIIEQSLLLLRTTSEKGLEAYLSSLETQMMAERALHLAIESCIDIANHIVAGSGLGRPANYAEVFRILHRQKIIDDSLAEKMMMMVRFRHRLVHMYSSIDNKLVFKFINEDLDDIRQFVKVIIQRLNLNGN
ncbi:MAG: DUF86 domain-containing protein [Candidatus Thorarchaeota archaeon]|nr:DUF86 domain-containing protein [Candidatus Thorarchaeota archaeon]